MNNKVLLMILDGWGNGRHDKADVISTVHPEYISAMTEKYPHAELRTDGENVGLPDGQMGNSEVGHLNIGAGRVVYQDLVKINRACRDNSIMQNPEVKAAFEYAKKNGVNVHFMGLVSDGGVHSSLEHLFKLCDIAAEYKIEPMLRKAAAEAFRRGYIFIVNIGRGRRKYAYVGHWCISPVSSLFHN